MVLDRRALAVLKKLNKNGISAYIVGGAVRDYLLNKKPHDYDICYNADISILYDIFNGHKIYETGIKYGTVTLNYKGLLIELTRFRTEEPYIDSRHPKTVNFVDSLVEDLSRRDFTINALAIDKDYNITDCFDGQSDLKNGIIRAVGEPRERFKEDALRILRAYRFLARFDFQLEENTKRAIFKENEGIKNLSSERITEELKQIFKGRYFYKIFNELLTVLTPIINSENVDINGALNLLKNASERLKFILFIMLFNCEKAVRLSNKELKELKALKDFEKAERVNIPKLFLSYELSEIELIIEYLSLKNLLTDYDKAQYDLIIKKGLNKEIKAIKINGNDLMSLGFTGTKIANIKADLSLLILERKIKNKKSVLIKFVKDNYK